MEEMTDDVEFEEVNEEGEVDTKTTIKKLRIKVKELEAEKREYLLGWQRAQADYANLKKEHIGDMANRTRLANKNLVEDLIPVLDSYYMARNNAEAWNKVDSGWRSGIEYIFNHFLSVLEKIGLSSFGEVGEKFNPIIHENIEIVSTEDSSKNDIIESILAKGYKMGDTIIRPARVKVFHSA